MPTIHDPRVREKMERLRRVTPRMYDAVAEAIREAEEMARQNPAILANGSVKVGDVSVRFRDRITNNNFFVDDFVIPERIV